MILHILGFCLHRHVGWPRTVKRGLCWQRCADCGQVREYRVRKNSMVFTHGRWMTDIKALAKYNSRKKARNSLIIRRKKFLPYLVKGVNCPCSTNSPARNTK